jgi:hypothetical protein
MVYQAKLKISRNKYQVDQNGKPYIIEEKEGDYPTPNE